MKAMHKLLAMVLALTLVLAMATTAFAADGTIQVEGTNIERTYTLYKMFDVETVKSNDGKTKYTYREMQEWVDFKNYAGDLYTVDNGYVYWGSQTVSAVDGAALAKLASQYVTTKGLTSDITVDVGAEAKPLAQGYYLMVPNDGTTCGVFIVTNDKATVIKEKTSAAGLPRVEKQVFEDSIGTYTTVNNVDIGEVFKFQTVITAGDEASNYVLHDVMSDHFVLVRDGGIELDGIKLSEENGDYKFVDKNATGDNCSFHIEFNHERLKHLKDGSKLIVHYSAYIKPCDDLAHAAEAMPNTVWMTYDSGLKTNESVTNTYTYQITVIKKDTDGNLLEGAEFVLQDQLGNYYRYDDTEKKVMWVTDETQATRYTTNAQGVVVFKGLDAEDFILNETKVPGGYVGSTQLEVSTKGDTDSVEGANATIEVINTLGNALPETGGMGTTMFYVVGGLLAAAAVVLMLTKKRVSAK